MTATKVQNKLLFFCEAAMEFVDWSIRLSDRQSDKAKELNCKNFSSNL